MSGSRGKNGSFTRAEHARVLKLVDRLDSGSSVRKDVGVRVPLRAPRKNPDREVRVFHFIPVRYCCLLLAVHSELIARINEKEVARSQGCYRRSNQAPGVSMRTLSKVLSATASEVYGPVYTRTKPFAPSVVEHVTPAVFSRPTY